jgi:hypothetical protein
LWKREGAATWQLRRSAWLHYFAILHGMKWSEFIAIALLGILAAVVIFIIYNGITL